MDGGRPPRGSIKAQCIEPGIDEEVLRSFIGLFTSF